MKIKLLILVIFFLSFDCLAEYDSLKEYKNKTNRLKKTDALKSQSAVDKEYRNLLEIRYHDINRMDTDSLEVKYNIYLWQCIADGICVFRYRGDENINFIIDRIKKSEKSIKNIRKYEKYNFRVF